MLDSSAVLRLLQLASPALPVGAYSYSEGIETLVEAGKIDSQVTLEHWLIQELRYGAIRLEAAVMVRGCTAIAAADWNQLNDWNRWLSAVRETEELRLQSWQMGRSLLRLFQDLQPQKGQLPTAQDVVQSLISLQQDGCNFAIAYGLVATAWKIDVPSSVLSYLYSWATNLVNAGIKLIPLGQTAGQQLLLNLQPAIEQATEEILALSDDELNSCGWGLSLASMAHEIQYSRLFRS